MDPSLCCSGSQTQLVADLSTFLSHSLSWERCNLSVAKLTPSINRYHANVRIHLSPAPSPAISAQRGAAKITIGCRAAKTSKLNYSWSNRRRLIDSKGKHRSNGLLTRLISWDPRGEEGGIIVSSGFVRRPRTCICHSALAGVIGLAVRQL